MTRILLIGLIGTSLLLGGGCSVTPPKVVLPPTECEPVIEVYKEMVGIPPELTQPYDNPAVPSQGDNAALLDWAQACASNARLLKLQLEKLRDLQ